MSELLGVDADGGAVSELLGVDTEKLTRPFPATALKSRTVDRGATRLSYVEGHSVIHRLNEATGNRWDFAVVDLDTSVAGTDKNGNDLMLMRATVALTLPGLGTRQHIGVQLVRANSGEDLVKGAVTDGLKKAATLFGVGLELYGPDYEAGEVGGDDGERRDGAANGREGHPAAVADEAPARRDPAAAAKLADIAANLSGEEAAWLQRIERAKTVGTLDSIRAALRPRGYGPDHGLMEALAIRSEELPLPAGR